MAQTRVRRSLPISESATESECGSPTTRPDSDVTVLLLAPWPETLWAFRHIWHRVSAVGRAVAIDMPGFGHSDGRPELLAPDAPGAFLAGLIEEWGLGAPHVVGPDVGTGCSALPCREGSERVTSLTVGGGVVQGSIETGGALKDIIEALSLEVVRGLDARTNIGYAVEAAAGSESEPEVHEEDYVSAYDLGRFAESARFVRHYPEQNPMLRDLLPMITTPTQVVAGRPGGGRRRRRGPLSGGVAATNSHLLVTPMLVLCLVSRRVGTRAHRT